MRTWYVIHGSCRIPFYTQYHTDQYCEALRANGTSFQVLTPEVNESVRRCLGRYLLSLDWGTDRWPANGLAEFPKSSLIAD
jgi:hypothetical protein